MGKAHLTEGKNSANGQPTTDISRDLNSNDAHYEYTLYTALSWSAKKFALQLCWRVFVLL